MKLSWGDIGYLAGLVDGDGSFSASSSRGRNGKVYWRPQMQVTLNTEETIHFLKTKYGGWTSSYFNKVNGYYMYRWAIGGPPLRVLLPLLLQYLQVKKTQGEIVLRWLEVKGQSGPWKAANYEEEEYGLRKQLALLNVSRRGKMAAILLDKDEEVAPSKLH